MRDTVTIHSSPHLNRPDKVYVSETAAMDAGKGRRVVVRGLTNRLYAVEMDLITLRELGLPVTITGSRRGGTLTIAIENGPVWRQKKT